MFLMCVFTVLTETDSSLAISGRERFVGRISQHPQLGGAQLRGFRRRGLITRSDRGSAKDVDDVAQQRRVRCLVPRRGLEQFNGTGHRERQHEAVGLRQCQRAFCGGERGALVAEFPVRELPSAGSPR